MTPQRRDTLTAAIGLITDVTDADAWGTLTAETRANLTALGATFTSGNTNAVRLGGVTASCAWDQGEHPLLRWAANARTALGEGTDANQTSEGEG